MTGTAADALTAAIDEMAALLAADGARLRAVAIDEVAGRVELAVDFDDATCEECVLPPDQLHLTVSAAVSRRVGSPVTVVLDDPRSTQAVAARPGTVVVLDPTGVAPDGGPVDPGPDAGPLRGKTIAIRHDVLWQSFDWTVDEWTRSLEAEGATVLTWRRVQGLVGPDYVRAQADYEAMLDAADVAIAGLANCGSCTSWTVRDALSAAERGVPTVAVATAFFEPLARLLAADGGRAGLRLLELPYPYDTMPEDEVRAHARDAFPRLLDVLGARA